MRILAGVRANPIAWLALFVSLGGTSVAAVSLKRGSVRAVHIAQGAIGSSELRAGAVGAPELRAGAVGPAHLAPGAVGTTALAPGSVGGGTVAAGSLSGVHLTDGSINLGDLGFRPLVPGDVGATGADFTEDVETSFKDFEPVVETTLNTDESGSAVLNGMVTVSWPIYGKEPVRVDVRIAHNGHVHGAAAVTLVPGQVDTVPVSFLCNLMPGENVFGLEVVASASGVVAESGSLVATDFKPIPNPPREAR